MTGWCLSMLLAYRPFFEPLPIDRFWYLLAIPLVVAIAVVYKTLKLPTLDRLVPESLLLAGQVLFFLVLAAVAVSVLTWWF